MKICIASVLKPIYDIHIYEKMAITLQEIFENSQVYVIGFKSNKDFKNKDINTKKQPNSIVFYPLFFFNRLSLKRIFSNWIFLRKLISIKPQLIVLETFELLPASIFYKFLRFLFFLDSVKIVYDVRENYTANILYTNVFPRWIRKLLAFGVKSIENLSSYFIDYLLFAETCFVDELPFLSKKILYQIIENKLLINENFQKFAKKTYPKDTSQKIWHKIQNNEEIKCIITGTISSNYGIFKAIKWIEKLQRVYPNASLKIVGRCMQTSEFVQIKEIVEKNPKIYFNVNLLTDVAHGEIMNSIAQADLALLPYNVQEAYKNRIPTKFYEYLYLQIPMIIQKNEVWENFLNQFSFKNSVFIDFSEDNSEKSILNQLKSLKFYENVVLPKEIFWSFEREKLWVLEDLFKK
jgi:hypothetical protein